MKRNTFTTALLALASLGVLGSSAQAQTAAPAWPTKPVRIIHGFTSGGPVDNLARLIAAQFGERFGQQAVVEGKPGAGGTIGANYVAKAEPDGYTLFLMASGHSAAPGLYKSLPFDPVNDFTMISMVARSPFAIIANPNAPFKTVQELVQQARAAPGKIDYGTGGQGSGMHLAGVLFQSRAEVKLTHVPYKGGSAPALAVIAGEVPLLFTSLAGMAAHIENGKVRPLAVTSKNRFALFPNIPSVAETVLPDFDVSAWYALAGPKGLPAPIVAQLNEMVQATLSKPSILETLRLQAADPWATSARDAQTFLGVDVARWTKVIRDEKIEVQN
ncbi:tripartite tricarboxylate transporter substrate binding protein [Hydrogenophaga laconesensis]|uniref:Tripartite-type tricarboxylate transporter receptor subunit TctC n=1 Tax=Hydrogenophaga laconesensis TaxID=1805971 RepID=A0ABU1VA17_9BURK|nr:tripartite tricarboxylate transporter substrate binding protein [Hydrogenophaga laconesensis]MDR7094308.1 tripartite-type tricarboxylate transporter receptor subunit TctC [Hydrogenophaga laconesensis]